MTAYFKKKSFKMKVSLPLCLSSFEMFLCNSVVNNFNKNWKNWYVYSQILFEPRMENSVGKTCKQIKYHKVYFSEKKIVIFSHFTKWKSEMDIFPNFFLILQAIFCTTCLNKLYSFIRKKYQTWICITIYINI